MGLGGTMKNQNACNIGKIGAGAWGQVQSVFKVYAAILGLPTPTDGIVWGEITQQSLVHHFAYKILITLKFLYCMGQISKGKVLPNIRECPSIKPHH